MVIIEETNNNKTENAERRGLRGAPDEVPTQTIINLQSGRKALERARLEEEQHCATLMDRSRLPSRLPEDWPEFVLTMALFFALLLGLYVGFIGSLRF